MGARRPGPPGRHHRGRGGEFGAHGFSRGSLNVIARRAAVAKGGLFRYFADQRDLYAFVTDIADQRVRFYMEELIRELDPTLASSCRCCR